MFTDISYYKGLINMPHLPTDNNFERDYIDIYEREILKAVLGSELYNLVVANKGAASGIYYDLINGADYSVDVCGDNVNLHWNGLLNDEKESLLSYYVWCKYVEDASITLTSESTVIQGAENANVVRPTNKLVIAYSRCAELTGDYPCASLGSNIKEGYLNKIQESLLNFLYYNIENYPEWVYSRPKIFGINKFGI